MRLFQNKPSTRIGLRTSAKRKNRNRVMQINDYCSIILHFNDVQKKSSPIKRVTSEFKYFLKSELFNKPNQH